MILLQHPSDFEIKYLTALGSPGPPEHVKVDEIKATTAQLSWYEGLDNHSPISSYTIQARTPFSVGWQKIRTGKEEYIKMLWQYLSALEKKVETLNFSQTIVLQFLMSLMGKHSQPLQ